MTPERHRTLTAYAAEMRAKLSSPVPSKHTARPEAYKAYLKRELVLAETRLQDATIAKPAADKAGAK